MFATSSPTSQQAGLAKLSKVVLKKYPHVRYVEAADNDIKDISALAKLPNLLVANLSNNKVGSVSADLKNEYLQVFRRIILL